MAALSSADDDTLTTDDAPADLEPATCWERFRAEQNPCRDWFLKQHPANDRPIDISASFAPEGCKPLFFKISCTAFVLTTAVWSFIDDKGDRLFWLAYATNWVELCGSIYMLNSLFMTLFGTSQPYKRVSSLFLKFTWLLFTFVSHFGILVAIFWWLQVYERGVTPLDWLNLVPHTVMPMTILLDGLNVNRIPLRWQHYWGFCIPMELSYVLWTYLQNKVFEMDNPNLSQDATDDAIYEAYNWKEQGTDPLVMSLIGILGFGPPLFFLLWMFSQYWVICLCIGDRRLYYSDPRTFKPRQGKIQGAGLAGMSSMRRMSFDDNDSYDDDDDSNFDSNEEGKEEEKIEDEFVDAEPKKFRSKIEELAYRA